MNNTSGPTVGGGSGGKDANEALTNKKSNPIWGEQYTENGMWEKRLVSHTHLPVCEINREAVSITFDTASF